MTVLQMQMLEEHRQFVERLIAGKPVDANRFCALRNQLRGNRPMPDLEIMFSRNESRARDAVDHVLQSEALRRKSAGVAEHLAFTLENPANEIALRKTIAVIVEERPFDPIPRLIGAVMRHYRGLMDPVLAAEFVRVCMDEKKRREERKRLAEAQAERKKK
jgi:hypothetical protein